MHINRLFLFNYFYMLDDGYLKSQPSNTEAGKLFFSQKNIKTDCFLGLKPLSMKGIQIFYISSLKMKILTD